jgi:hypothetical protein
MDDPAPQLDEELLDRYALIFARMALDRLMAGTIDDDGHRAENHAEEKCAADPRD